MMGGSKLTRDENTSARSAREVLHGRTWMKPDATHVLEGTTELTRGRAHCLRARSRQRHPAASDHERAVIAAAEARVRSAVSVCFAALMRKHESIERIRGRLPGRFAHVLAAARTRTRFAAFSAVCGRIAGRVVSTAARVDTPGPAAPGPGACKRTCH